MFSARLSFRAACFYVLFLKFCLMLLTKLSLLVACLPRTTSLCLRDQYLVSPHLYSISLSTSNLQSVGRSISDEQSRNHNDGRTTARQRNGYVLQLYPASTMPLLRHLVINTPYHIQVYEHIFIQTVTAQSKPRGATRLLVTLSRSLTNRGIVTTTLHWLTQDSRVNLPGVNDNISLFDNNIVGT